jgi:signal transduction histidine kinase
VSRRALAWLIAGAVASTACYFLVARPPGPNAYLIFYLGTSAVAVAFLAAGLAAWLQAEVQAQLELVRASRARIVEVEDAERRRLERDLHDGAQQRLVTLTLALGMARSRVAGVDPELEALIEAAGKEAKEALANVAKHARAGTAQVSIRRLPGRLAVRVSDGAGGARPEADIPCP